MEKIDPSRTRKDKPIESGNRNIIDIYVLGHAPYASENRVKGGLSAEERGRFRLDTGGRGETGGFLRGSNGR